MQASWPEYVWEWLQLAGAYDLLSLRKRVVPPPPPPVPGAVPAAPLPLDPALPARWEQLKQEQQQREEGKQAGLSGAQQQQRGGDMDVDGAATAPAAAQQPMEVDGVAAVLRSPADDSGGGGGAGAGATPPKAPAPPKDGLVSGAPPCLMAGGTTRLCVA